MHEPKRRSTAPLPIMEAFLPVAVSVLGVFAGHSGVIVALAAAVGGFAAAILVANAALSAYETVQSVATLVQDAWNASQFRRAAANDRIHRTASRSTTRSKSWSARLPKRGRSRNGLNAAMDANPDRPRLSRSRRSPPA
jgi:hypothetical protein